MGAVVTTNYQKVIQSDLLSFLTTELAAGRTVIPGDLGLRVVKDRGFSVSSTVGSSVQDRLFEVQTAQNRNALPVSVSVYFSQNPTQVQTAITTEAAAGRELVATHFEADKFGTPSVDLVFYQYYGGSKLDFISVDLVAEDILSAAEQDTGLDLPALSFVRGVVVEVITPEATGSTKTLDLGVLAFDSAFWFSGLDVSAAGQYHHQVDGTQNNHSTIDGQSVSWTMGSNDWVEFVARLHFEVRTFN